MNETNKQSRKLFIITLMWAAAYPGLLNLFSLTVAQYNAVPSELVSFCAILIMLLLIFLPIMALFSASRLKNTMFKNTSSVRVLLFILVATPPAYILIGTVSGLLGVGHWQPWLWVGGILGGFSLTKFAKTENTTKASFQNYNLVKKAHRISGLLLIFGFIGLHIFNHAAALISTEKHEELRLLFRSWYAGDLIEPIMFVLLIMMGLTGIPMVKRYMRSNTDIYKTLQIGSGIYMVFFLCAHVNAVLSARSRAVETDWIFATGENGLIDGYFFLIPYYILSVGMIWIHASAGVRMILLANKMEMTKANNIFKILAVTGLITTLLVGGVLLGVQL